MGWFIGKCNIWDYKLQKNIEIDGVKWKNDSMWISDFTNDIFSLPDFLKNNKNPVMLDMSGHEMGNNQTQILAAFLKDDVILTALNLSNNRIANSGATALARALEVNNILTYLDLHYNAIEDYGASDLANALAINNTLKYINLVGNKIESSILNEIYRCIYA